VNATSALHQKESPTQVLHQSEQKDIKNGRNAKEMQAEEESHRTIQYDPKGDKLKQQQISPMDNDKTKPIPDSIFHEPAQQNLF
jgi:hypothetical protein